ncbi:aspartyl/asparaginyl beta-hydroxylase domain-containing protein [Prochlorothrix hollandica]|nr:aspartyl/asparaginyl beta-hydroxylase domain-containing protein [Prochlorothrix hollandica]
MTLLMPKDQTDQASPNKTKTMRELGPVDISGIRDAILNLPLELWESEDTSKPNKFKELGRTSHIVFKFVKDYDNHSDAKFYDLWEEWKEKLQPVLEEATRPYGYAQGNFSRIMLAKLPAHSKIKPHIDPYDSSNFTHKIHIPIRTHADVEFMVGTKRYHFPEGYAFEVNNKAIHAAFNNSDIDRIHLIIEYFEEV